MEQIKKYDEFLNEGINYNSILELLNSEAKKIKGSLGFELFKPRIKARAQFILPYYNSIPIFQLNIMNMEKNIVLYDIIKKTSQTFDKTQISELIDTVGTLIEKYMKLPK